MLPYSSRANRSQRTAMWTVQHTYTAPDFLQGLASIQEIKKVPSGGLNCQSFVRKPFDVLFQVIDITATMYH